MSSLKFVYLSIFGFVALLSYNDVVMGEEATTDLFDTCPIMDPATIQRRICELQYRVEELHALLFNGLPDENQMTSDSSSSSTGLNVQKEKRKNEFIRFGKRKNEFIRFGKRKNEFIRFGRSANPEEPEQEQFVAKRKNEFIRFG